jgi:WD40 repeat protein
VSTIACANHDGSINLWNVNSGKRLVSVKAEKGSSLKSIDWNNLETDLILTGSFSSRVKLFDINNLEIIVGIFAEHTNIVNSVKWNTNNRDEFASVSEDGLCKIWDRRANNKTSVNTLMDRQSPGALRCCDWHKQNVCFFGMLTLRTGY